MNAYDILAERGFIEQATHEDEIRKLLGEQKITFYIGFDPTADSLTVGHFVTVMAMSHMQRAGHRPIALVGGGTAMVGDPTNRTEMRKMMSREEIVHNSERFRTQLSRFLDFSDGKAIMADNSDWLLPLQYIPFIREYGVHFSVNRMLAADAYKTRFERGLSFLEFNYMIMQSYDFLELNRRYGCVMQMGGNDQWSNIIAGADLIRRADNKDAHGLTIALLTTSDGKKMGKTQAGAIWLDPNKTSPYDFYQYMRNTADADVIKCLKLMTYVPMDEINELAKLKDNEINKAKDILAFETTKIIHGEAEAEKARQAARALFGTDGGSSEGMPSTKIKQSDFGGGMNIVDLICAAGLAPSKSEGRRNVQQGGICVNGTKITDITHAVTKTDFTNGALTLQKGKKTFHMIKLIQ